MSFAIGPADTPELIAATALAVFVAGVVRGYAGFGTAIILAPVLGWLYSPVVAVPMIAIVDMPIAMWLLALVWRDIRWRQIGFLIPTAWAGVPLGVWLLLVVPKAAMLVFTGVLVAGSAIVLLRGWQYKGRRGPAVDAGVGLVSGVLGGSTSISGPPVVLYLFSGPGTVAQHRAQMIGFLSAASLWGIGVFIVAGALDANNAALGLAGVPVFLLGAETGRRLVRLGGDALARRIILSSLLGIGVTVVAIGLATAA